MTLMVTDDQGATGSTSSEVTVSSDPPEAAHICDLDGAAAPAPRNWWEDTFTVAIHDATEGAIDGTTVSGSWRGGANGGDSCLTGVDGLCSITKGNLKNNADSVTFTISGVAGPNLAYDASANHDPDGDSDGTVLTVARP